MEHGGDGAAHAAPVASEGVGVHGEGCSSVPQTSSASAGAEMALVGEGEQQLLQQLLQDARTNSTPAAPAAGACRALGLLALLVVVAGIVVDGCTNSTPAPDAAAASGACVSFTRFTAAV